MPDQNEIQAELVDDVQPFTMIQNGFIDDVRVSPAAFRLFVTLKSYTSGRSTAKTAFPSYETIREKSGLGSYATIVRAIRELESLGWITRVKRYGRSTLYTLRASPTETVGLQKVKDQSYRNCRISPTVSVGEQEVVEQQVQEQQVEAADPGPIPFSDPPPDPFTKAARDAGLGNTTSYRSRKAKDEAKKREDAKYDIGDLEDYPSIVIYLAVFQGILLPRDLAQKIVDAVGEPTPWEETCKEWAKGNPTTGKTWNPLSIDKMLILYQAKCAQGRAKQNGHKVGPAVSDDVYASIKAKIEATL